MKAKNKYHSVVAKLLILVLAGLSLIQPFQKQFITAGFYLNRNYIATNFCENVDEPELHCEGICQLKKSLENAGEQEQEEIIQRLKLEIQFIETAETTIEPIYAIVQTRTLTPLDVSRPTDPWLSGIFKPPVAS